MIGRLSGVVAAKDFTRCLIDVNGVGYDVQIPLSTFDALPRENEPAVLQIVTQVREDAITLFGFATEDEKRLFNELLNVSGIGGKLALSILSGMPIPSLVAAIVNSDVKLLSKIPGIGKRTAERLIVELRDKLSKSVYASGFPLNAASGNAGSDENARQNAAISDALLALSQLGFKSETVTPIVQQLAQEISTEECSSENLLRLALQRMNSR